MQKCDVRKKTRELVSNMPVDWNGWVRDSCGTSGELRPRRSASGRGGSAPAPPESSTQEWKSLKNTA